jgi:2',3'-cyclic-nucleotide 2'-phosphodiesterase
MKKLLRLLFIGDVIGSTGCAAVKALVPMLRKELRLDAAIANAENSAEDGLGATPEAAMALLSVLDFVTLGDHAFDRAELTPFLDADTRIIRPANFETPSAGRGWGSFKVAGVRVGVVSLLGRVFMRPSVTPLHKAADQAFQELQALGATVIVVDMHAEATSEKQAMGWLLAGRVAALLGTHTHTPTADLRVLPGGTAYVSDVGMAGGSDSIIGFRKDFLRRSHGENPVERPKPADGPARLDAVLIEADPASGRALSAERVTREFLTMERAL